MREFKNKMISVCMATYNGEKYITEQVESILSQLSENDELVVSDDGSTDSTLKILESFNDKRIKVFHHDKKSIKVPFLLGSKFADHFYFAARNFENALKHSKGDYIFLSDQDDVWLPNKVKKVLPHLNEDKLVISDAWIVDSELKKIAELSKYRTYKKGFITNIYIKGGPIHGCVCAFTKKIKDFILPIPKNALTHDFWIGLLAELKFSSIYIPEQLILYRRHTSTVSHTEKSQHSLLYILRYRMFMLYECLKRFLFRK
ncbi:MAG: glycosyltransferase family 2 protein [Fibromonadaceae bacterium]|jgi:glycosyltransferase involved in cell wall biosynthesis|nr:glycosyltransferase family 2 protein [Fibromonadaceae bacterium]